MSARPDAAAGRTRGRRRARTLIVFGALLAALVLPAPAAHAHPLGNFSVNTANAIRVQPAQVLVDHVVDLAEIPSSQVRPEIDRVGRDAWRDAECATAGARLRLAVDGRAVALSVATVTHTVGVLLLGVVLSVSTTFAPDRAYPWLALLSGLLLTAIG